MQNTHTIAHTGSTMGREHRLRTASRQKAAELINNAAMALRNFNRSPDVEIELQVPYDSDPVCYEPEDLMRAVATGNSDVLRYVDCREPAELHTEGYAIYARVKIFEMCPDTLTLGPIDFLEGADER